MDKCIIWTGSKDGKGYGETCVNGKKISTHRLALILKLGRGIEIGKWALHKCHVPACVNPNHLYEGTPKENTGDMLKSGRDSSGEPHGKKVFEGQVLHHRTKHSPDKIKEVKKRLALGEKMISISKEFGLTYNYVQKIKYGVLWKWL